MAQPEKQLNSLGTVASQTVLGTWVPSFAAPRCSSLESSSTVKQLEFCEPGLCSQDYVDWQGVHASTPARSVVHTCSLLPLGRQVFAGCGVPGPAALWRA
eukprot:357261-Chlamydomonas_euryale.AAC.3